MSAQLPRLVRLALQFVLFLLLVSAVVGVASPDTGIVMKGVCAALAGICVWLATVVRRIGARSAPSST